MHERKGKLYGRQVLYEWFMCLAVRGISEFQLQSLAEFYEKQALASRELKLFSAGG